MLRRRAVVLGGVAACAGCASLGGLRTVEVSQAQLLDAIARQFPLRLGGPEPFELVAVSPRLRAMPKENRLATEVDLDIGPGIAGRVLSGTVGFSYGLRYEPADHTVRMNSLRVDRLDLGPYGDLLRLRAGSLASLLAEELLEGLVVYALGPEDVRRLDAGGYQPGDIRVTPAGLAITLVPRR
ncbi:hypothetical protein M8A51_01685 [Schlegelella sp. S2-27]|uniref:DUF1439 domain-containing protein n=1 Tax=Caldimonas mangrovi TaxID=2944811 RepID=A0ABT0YHP5_9BURK|nr:hypothetical protein [Caldimonas mangrovi]MCM5678237.1 hypothetical protein [Caldimonas mangrovi]